MTPQLLALVLLLLAVSASAEVVQLTSKTFAAVNKEGDWLLKFYAPWCGHCKRLEPTYAQVASSLSSTPTKVGKIDGSTERSLAAIFSITGFPSIFYVAPDGQTVYKYKGSRTAEAIVSYVKSGYKQDEALSFWSGPFGIVGQCKWFLLWLGSFMFTFYEYLDKTLGMGPVPAGLVVVFGGMIITASAVVGMTVATAPDLKRD
ncbi:hypothetical protein TL16_g08356 [Triparma laevis f. inornata]|uniref:Thioredoxin domain-containing protein n=2 Tax=Triparma laevis TaxID=1534972 RepID=A0A9W7FN98_9STRA|nr:hypothetical protein TL16_g08356 [Triparma laevis f. inornata]GMI15817.1 hypothetical protein TrLO_g2727 [Triparma laevis f. longispina]